MHFCYLIPFCVNRGKPIASTVTFTRSHRSLAVIPLTSRFSVSTVSSAESVSSPKEEKTEAHASLHSGATNHSQLSGSLASLIAIKQDRRKAIAMDGAVIQPVRYGKMERPKIVNHSRHEEVATALPNRVGLPPNPKAFLAAQQRQKTPGSAAKTASQYRLPTSEDRANLKRSPVPMQSAAERKRELNPRDNKVQAAKLNSGWQTAQEILGTKE